MKTYYSLMFLVFAIVAVYAFLCPFLISYPNDGTVIAGFVIGIGAVPVFILLSIKILKNLIKTLKK